MHRVAAWTFTEGFGVEERFVATLGITTTLAYGISAVTFFLIEKPGQRLGKELVRRVIGNCRKSDPTLRPTKPCA
jgi:peptidoglycan/LPS O-acetylase OafA/YrhL